MKIREIPLSRYGLLTVAEAAGASGKSEKTLQNWVREGRLGVVIVGRVWLIDAKELKRVKAPRRGPRKDP